MKSALFLVFAALFCAVTANPLVERGGYDGKGKDDGPRKDVCANVHAKLQVEVPIKHSWRKKTETAGYINQCLCLSGVPHFVNTDKTAQHAIQLVGWRNAHDVTEDINKLIYKARDHKFCRYPAHSDPFCAHYDPCAWKCDKGFEVNPRNRDECIPIHKPNSGPGKPRPKPEPHKPQDGGKAHDGDKPHDGGKPPGGDKPHDGGKPHNSGKPYDGGKPHDDGKPKPKVPKVPHPGPGKPNKPDPKGHHGREPEAAEI